MYILEATENATGSWHRVLFGGEYLIANRTADALGGGTLAIEFADTEEEELAMTTDATFTAPIKSQTVVLARGSLVRAKLTGATAPVCNVLLQHTEIQDPTLKVLE